MNLSTTASSPTRGAREPTAVPAPMYAEPLIPEHARGDMATRRLVDSALALADVVQSDGITERSYSLVGFISDGARTRAKDVIEAVAALRSNGALAHGTIAVLGTTPGVYYGVPVQTARHGLELLEVAETEPTVSFDNVMPDLRALVIAGKVLEFHPPTSAA